MKPFSVFLAISLLSLTVLRAEPREWTEQATGRKINAEFVALEGDQVKLRMNGREVLVPVARLSEADQSYLKIVGGSALMPLAAEDPSPAPAAPAAAATGKLRKVDISAKAFPAWEGYYSGPFGKKLLKFYEKSKGIVDVEEKDTMTTPESAVMWVKDDKLGKMNLFVPPNYDGSIAFGALVYVSPSNEAVGLMPGWNKLFEEKKLIYCSPVGTGNDQADMRRMALALDAVATVEAGYKVDPERVFASGTSGGGAIATTIGVHYPEFYAIDCSRGSEPEGKNVFPYLDSGDIRQVAKRKRRFAWVSGPKDRNYAYIKRGVTAWNDAGVEAKLFEDPNQGHAAGTEDLMRQAITWIEEKPVK